MGFEDINRMPMASIQHYLQRLPERQAEMRTMLIEAASWPHLKEDARRKAAQQLERALGVKTRTPTPAELALIGIGVELHKVDPVLVPQGLPASS